MLFQFEAVNLSKPADHWMLCVDQTCRGRACGAALAKAQLIKISSKCTPTDSNLTALSVRRPCMVVQEAVPEHFDTLHPHVMGRRHGPFSAHYHAWFGSRIGTLWSELHGGPGQAKWSSVHCRSACSSALPSSPPQTWGTHCYPNCTSKACNLVFFRY